MKKLLIILSLFLFGCNESAREEIISRYPTGEKEVVVKYQGKGSEEKIIERTTYNIQGEPYLYENLIDGTSKEYVELNGLYEAEKFKKYLQGNVWKLLTTESYTHYLLWENDTEYFISENHKDQISYPSNHPIIILDSLNFLYNANTDEELLTKRFTPISPIYMEDFRGLWEKTELTILVPQYKLKEEDESDDW